MTRGSETQTNIKARFDGEKLTVSCDLGANPISLPWGAELSSYELVIGKEGILMGRLELREKIREVAAALSVSPEYPVMLD